VDALRALLSYVRRANVRQSEQLLIVACKLGHLDSCSGAQGTCVSGCRTAVLCVGACLHGSASFWIFFHDVWDPGVISQ
jgi:hypothetical protein